MKQIYMSMTVSNRGLMMGNLRHYSSANFVVVFQLRMVNCLYTGVPMILVR